MKSERADLKRVGSRVTRRGIQITLGLLWILDGGLQFQPVMLTSRFATGVIAPAGDGQPAFVGWPVHQAAGLIGRQPALTDVAFGLFQLALGAGLLHRRTVRWALTASVAWALSVWYLGEGLGGLFGGGASMLTGAPGSALLYAVVAMAAWPRPGGGPGDQRPARRAAAAWAGLWLGGSFLQLLPGNDTNASVSMALTMNASGAPGWLAAAGHQLAALVPDTGVSLIADLVALQALAGLGVLMGGRRTRRTAVIGGIALSLVFWVAGQGAGQYWTGISTDPNTAPLVVLLGVAVLGAAPWRQPGRRPDTGNSGSGRRALVSMTAKAEGGMVTVS